MIFLHCVLLSNLVDDHIELVDLSQDGKFQMAAPCTFLSHFSDVLINSSIFVFNSRLVLIFMCFNLVCNSFSQSLVHELFTIKLISKGSEEAIAIISCLLDHKSALKQLKPVLD